MASIGPVGPNTQTPDYDPELRPPAPPPAAQTQLEAQQAAAMAAMRAVQQAPALREYRGLSGMEPPTVTGSRGASRTETGGEAHAGLRIQGRAGPVSGAAGASVNGSISDRRDGTDRVLTGQAQAQVDARIALQTGRGGAAFSIAAGARAEFTQRVPNQQPGAGVANPLDPRTLPVGGSLTLSAERFRNIGFEATFRGLATETNISDVNRVSARIERTGENTVRVTAGPTHEVTADNAFGVNVGEARARAGRNDRVEGSQQRTATFDLSTPQGAEGYRAFISSGRLPTDNGPGVSGVQTVRSLEQQSAGRVSLSLGDLSHTIPIESTAGSRVQTQQPDGSSAVATDLRWGNNVPLRMEQQFGADGREAAEARRYNYDLRLDPTTAAALNAARGPDAEQLRAGQNVTVSLTQEQMEQLRQTAAGAAQGRAGRTAENPFRTVLEDTAGRPHDTAGFGVALARSMDPYAFATALMRLAPNGGAPISVTPR